MSDMTEMPVGAHADLGFSNRNLRLLADIPLTLSVEVGSTSLRLADLLGLSAGAVVELDRDTGALLDIKANGTLVARGEVVTVGGKFGIRVVEVVAPETRLANLGMS